VADSAEVQRPAVMLTHTREAEACAPQVERVPYEALSHPAVKDAVEACRRELGSRQALDLVAS
jgi:hypothetical protein